MCIRLCVYIRLPQVGVCAPNIQQLLPTGQMVRQNLYVYSPPHFAHIFTHTHTYITQLLRKTHIVTQKHAKKADTTAREDRQTKHVHYLCTKDIAFKTKRRDTKYKKCTAIGQSELSVALM